MYPELIALDDTLDIDPAYRQGGSESFADIGGNTFGDVEGALAAQPAPAQTVGTLGGPGYGGVPWDAAGPRVTGGQIRPGSRSSQPDAEAQLLPRSVWVAVAVLSRLQASEATRLVLSRGLPRCQWMSTMIPAVWANMGTPGVASLMRELLQLQPLLDPQGSLLEDRLRQWTPRLMMRDAMQPVGGGIADLTPTPAPSRDEETMQRLADLRRRGAFTIKRCRRWSTGMQEGGKAGVEIDIEMEDTMEANGARLIEQTAAAMRSMPEEQAEAVINRFIDEYGSEAFEVLRNRVLRDIVPNAQTEGRIEGQGGGMDDMIPGMIGTQQPVAVSPGEYIVPADVVSGLGDGDTNAGAGELDDMLDRVRQTRTGRRSAQPEPLDKNKVMPA